MNVNDIAAELSLPQSTVSTNLQMLEEAGLIRTETRKAMKGSQKVCYPTAEEVLVVFKSEYRKARTNEIEELDLKSRHSIRVRIRVKDDAKHPGGINIFGGGFAITIRISC